MSDTCAKTKWVDYSKCIGCESCEAICKHLWGLSRIQMTQTDDGLMFPLYCHHCEAPQCMKACPVGAIRKEEGGAVLHDPEICRGCRAMHCMEACPFGAIYHAGGVVPITKCDLCAERRQVGLGPACVEICPVEAIYWVDTTELPKLRSDESMARLKLVMAHISAKRKKAKPATKPEAKADKK